MSEDMLHVFASTTHALDGVGHVLWLSVRMCEARARHSRTEAKYLMRAPRF